jgi:hypothetical protein
MKLKISLTVSAHTDSDALLQSAGLAARPVDSQGGTLLVLGTRPVLDLLLDAASEETLRRRRYTTVSMLVFTACTTLVTCLLIKAL